MITFGEAMLIAAESELAGYEPGVQVLPNGFEDDTHWALILQPGPPTGRPTPLVDKQTGVVTALQLPADQAKLDGMRPYALSGR